MIFHAQRVDSTGCRSLLALTVGLLLSCLASAQPAVFGVYVDSSGSLRQREQDARDELSRVRTLAARASKAGQEKLHFVSLPTLLADARAAIEAHQPRSEELKCLGGLTQIRYVFLDPEQKDLLIAGPAEPVDATSALEPRGKLTGRPVLQLDDLVVALRLAGGQRPGQPFGCSIDPPDHALDRAKQVMSEYAGRPRSELAQAMSRGLGPQQVRFFGAPADTRMAFICVAADYQLKRYSIGIDAIPVAGVGHSIDSSRPAGNGFWFEMLYEPLLVSPDASAYEIRGQRLQLRAGAIPFDERGATETAKTFARNFTAKIPALAAAVPLFADLQNIADLSLLASLIRQDQLDRRSGLDLSWVLTEKNYPVASVAVPRSTDTLVNFAGGSLAAGGVSLTPTQWLADSAREVDKTGALARIRPQTRPAE